MIDSKLFSLADRWATASVTLVRWLRAVDPEPRLSGPQASALAIIVHSGGITPSALATLEEVKRSTIARTVGQLSDLGLIERSLSKDDRRSVTLTATAHGSTVLARGQRRRVAPLAQAFATLSDRDRERLAHALTVIESIVAAQIAKTAVEPDGTSEATESP